MSLFEDFSPVVLGFAGVKQKLNMLSDNVMLQATQTLLNTTCSSTDSDTCRDDSTALTLKLIAIGSILVAGVTGISIPLIGKYRRGFLSHDSDLFVAAKAFAAGVILATGFVHMLPDAASNLTNSCLPTYPWSAFPFSGFFAMFSALLTLLADFVGTQIYENKQGKKKGVMPVVQKDGMQIVGIHGHVDEHLIGGMNAGDSVVVLRRRDEEEDGHGHGHSHGFGGEEGDDGGRHAVVSQVLELGIVSHSVIIGLSIGVSQSPCVIRPLVAALSFHQFFEGFALGGCISQAPFTTLKTALMSSFFAITTPSGIAIGIGLASFYNADSAAALIVEGTLDAISSGILIYMSLVDLIAADFMSKRMRCNVRLQVVSYSALFMGAALMSSLAIWS